MSGAVHTSTLHRHTLDSSCLVAVERLSTEVNRLIPDDEPDGPNIVKEPGWYFCRTVGHNVHDHDGKLWSHQPRVRPCPPLHPARVR